MPQIALWRAYQPFEKTNILGECFVTMVKARPTNDVSGQAVDAAIGATQISILPEPLWPRRQDPHHAHPPLPDSAWLCESANSALC